MREIEEHSCSSVQGDVVWEKCCVCVWGGGGGFRGKTQVGKKSVRARNWEVLGLGQGV